MAKLYNLARMTVSGTPGTGTITLLAAVSGHLTFAQAGVSTGETVSYGIEDGTASEVGTGVYTTAGLTLTRSVVNSTNSNALVSLTSAAQVYITALKADIANLGEINTFSTFTNFLANVSFPDGKGIIDDSANEQLLFDKATTAVNFLRIANAATGNQPHIAADGSDTDISFSLVPKGGGSVEIPFDVDAEIRPLFLSNNNAGSTSQTNFQMNSGSSAQFQFSVRHAAAESSWYVNVGKMTLTTATAGTEIAMRAGDAFNNLQMDDTGRVWNEKGAIPYFWVYWTANSTTILNSYNMTSIADTATGDADGTINVDFGSSAWAGFVSTNDTTNAWDNEEVQSSGFNARAAGTFGVLSSTITDGTTAATSLIDPDQWQVMGMGTP